MADYIPRTTVKQLREITLHDYLSIYEPEQLVKTSTNTYKLKEHDSCVLFANGTWHRYATGQHGKTALDYLIDVRGYTFQNACEHLRGMVSDDTATIVAKSHIRSIFKESSEDPVPGRFILPKPDADNRKVMEYLTQTRGINSGLVKYFIGIGHLYQTTSNIGDKRCVFLGKDDEGNPRHASLRSVTRDIKGDAQGSDKAYSMFIKAISNTAATLHIFESAIDLLSTITLTELNSNIDAREQLRNGHYLAISGGLTTRSNNLPPAIKRVVDNPGIVRLISNVILHFDNDGAGKKSSASVKNAITAKGIAVTEQFPSAGYKDFNDELTACIEK